MTWKIPNAYEDNSRNAISGILQNFTSYLDRLDDHISNTVIICKMVLECFRDHLAHEETRLIKIPTTILRAEAYDLA